MSKWETKSFGSLLTDIFLKKNLRQRLIPSRAMYCLKMTSLSAYFDIIFFGTTRHFVQCSSLIGTAKKEDMEEKVVYAIANGESFTSGTTIERPNITLTFGETGGPDFLPANHDPLNHIFQNLLPGNEVNGNMPGGTFYVFSPQKDGILTIAVRQNRIKKLYIEENGTPLPEFKGVTLDESHSLEYMFTLPVKAGASYKLYCEGSKLGFYGFIFLSRVGLMCDVNGDGEVNAADIVCLIKIIL